MREFLSHTQDLLLKCGAAVLGFFHGMAQGDNRSAFLLVALMVADYITGLLAAALGKSRKSAHGKLSSEVGAKGILRKALILLVVAFAYGLDYFVNEGNAMFSTATIWFYISNEGISLLENLALSGVPVPKKLRLMLERISEVEEPPAQGAPAVLPTQPPVDGAPQGNGNQTAKPRDNNVQNG